MKYEVWVLEKRLVGENRWRQFFCDGRQEALDVAEGFIDIAEKIEVKPFNEYLGMSAEQLLADPEAPESLRIAARIELEKAQKFNLEAEAARTATDKPV